MLQHFLVSVISSISSFQPFLFLCLFINSLTNLSEKSQSDCEESSPLQTLELAESVHIKRRAPVPPEPPPEKQFEVSIRKAAAQLVRLPPKTLPKPRPQSQHPFSVVKLRHVDQTHAETEPEPQPESADPPASTHSCHSAIHFMTRVLQRLREVDEYVSEKKAQTQQAREFHSKSIKEKAVHLSGLFSADSPAALKGGSVRRPFLPSGDKCHSCERRVYMVERVCAEGLYFHRECFRCSTCSSALRQGAHAFDSEQGKLYCKLHFDQRNNGTNLRRNFSLRSNRYGAGVQEQCAADGQSSESSSTEDLQSQPSAGTFSSFMKKHLSWPLSVTRAVCNAPRYLSHRVCSTAQAIAGHLRDNAQDYAYLYELLSMSLPLLLVLQEVLLQMYTEAVPDGPSSLQPLLLWLQEQIGHRLI